MIRSILRASLDALDMDVFLAADGLEAEEFASRIRAVLIILDLRMPRLNGLLACQQIRLLLVTRRLQAKSAMARQAA
jgi:DNA-binding response OmpR family regulator